MKQIISICGVLVTIVVSILFGQLSQSGGNATGGAVSQSGTWTVQPGNTANTTAWKVDGSAVTQPVSGTFWQATQPISGTVTVNALPTGTNTIGKSAPLTSCGTTALTTAWAAVPTSNTAVTGTTTCVFALTFTNTNASAQTVTVTDGQGSPITVISAFSIPGSSSVTFPL